LSNHPFDDWFNISGLHRFCRITAESQEAHDNVILHRADQHRVRARLAPVKRNFALKRRCCHIRLLLAREDAVALLTLFARGRNPRDMNDVRACDCVQVRYDCAITPSFKPTETKRNKKKQQETKRNNKHARLLTFSDTNNN
jgi:hypothetical protein